MRKPIIIKSSRSVFIDVDNTLIFARAEFPRASQKEEEVIINGREFRIHLAHVEIIKDFKARGQCVVIWSQGGWEWANKIVEVLELEEYVDVIMSKPDWYFDDKGSEDWLGESRKHYINL
jgi:phosphoserine phosphatase